MAWQVEITKGMLRSMARGKSNTANLNSVYISLKALPQDHELLQSTVLPHYLCQLLHESGSFKWDREIWGPTATQKRIVTGKQN